jgi:hypothetical protein
VRLTLLHPYDPACRPADQVETWDALADPQMVSLGEWWHVATVGPLAYAQALQRLWEVPGDLVVIEQDIVARSWHLIELADCPEAFCAFDYLLANGEPWTAHDEHFGAGLVKYGQAARAAVVERPQVPQSTWRGMPALLRWRLPPFHVHRPMVTHNHVGA